MINIKKWIVLILILSLYGCYSTRQAVKDFGKSFNNYPDTISALIRAVLPCDVQSSDTVEKTVLMPVENDTIIVVDSIMVECPEGADSIVVKTSKTVITKTVKTIIEKEITLRIKDTKDSVQLSDRLRISENKLYKIEKGRSSYRTLFYFACGLLLLFLLGIYFLISKKYKSVKT